MRSRAPNGRGRVRPSMNGARAGLFLPLFFATMGPSVVSAQVARALAAAARPEGSARAVARLDHTCGGGIPDCAACCGTLAGDDCIEVSRSDCVLLHQGNPQEPGSDCHDFSGNGSADACEPDFPLCLPSADRLSCNGLCPGPLACNPSKVRVNLTTFQYEVLECSCRPCRVCVECDAFPPPCMQGCQVGSACVRNETCYSSEICDIICSCEEQGVWSQPFDWGLPGELIVPIHATVVPVREGFSLWLVPASFSRPAGRAIVARASAFGRSRLFLSPGRARDCCQGL
jgi:hypothetical protein